MHCSVQDMKTIDVALATYNGERFIEEQLESILAQTIKPQRIFIADDCSSDGTYGILQKYSNKYDCIKLYRNERNIGYARNFWNILSLCDADYIALSDQDDIWFPHKLEVCLDALKAEEHAGICYHDSLLMYEDGHYLEGATYKNFSRWKWPFVQSEIVHHLAIGDGAVPTPGFMLFFDSRLLKQYREHLYMGKFISHDWTLSILYFSFFPPVYIQQPLAAYRLHPQQVSGAMDYFIKNTKYDVRRKRNLKNAILAEWRRFIHRSANKKKQKIEHDENRIDRILALDRLSEILKFDEKYSDAYLKKTVLSILDDAIHSLHHKIAHRQS